MNFDQKRLDKIKTQYDQTRPNLTLELIAEVERLQVIETKWTELLPNLDILRHYLFRVDHKLASLGEMIETPAEIVDYTSAFLSVLEVYFPSTEEEELAASELTRLERLGLELSQTGGELKEEVRREFASLKAQIDTQITRLEAEIERLQADSRALEQKNQRLRATVAAYGSYIRGEITVEQLERALIEVSADRSP